MRRFACSVCQRELFFENVHCGGCGHDLAYLPDLNVVTPLELAPPEAPGDAVETSGTKNEATAVYGALAPEANGRRIRLCANYANEAVCNWAVSDDRSIDTSDGSDAATPIETAPALCASCRLNRVIPNLDSAGAKQAWFKLEAAKRRVLYTLQRVGLPLDASLAFSFKEDQADEKVYTGHEDGLITINIAEADDAYREKMRVQLGEAYRTVLGHVRHEIGHYYWDRLIAPDPAATEAFRKLFGDEREDYAAARDRHYANGANGTLAPWQLGFVSAYAAMHPWEDWAESFAHLLHMLDTLETAGSHGLAIRPTPDAANTASGADIDELPIALPEAGMDPNVDAFDQLVAAWLPLTSALNCLNRSMGLPDSYPFVLSAPAIEKLRFVHGAVVRAAASGPAVDTSAP